MNQQRITVMQVARSIGITMSNAAAWSVGSLMASRYAETFGEQPPKDNRPKTNGSGSHCFALYPATWREQIEAAIRSAVDIERAQPDLFTD